ncbi:MAG: hypothetical protein MUF53_12155 [Gemmatimonadaceae bacterium]|jgi:hypothetical protein|nr:hypothetical protein [Gemmatimonadaceae bacterium]
MLASLLRLAALRPLLGAAIFGIPVLVLIAIGLFAVWLLKFLLYIVLPVAVVVWLVRKLRQPAAAPVST